MKANIKVELSNNTLVVTKKFFKNAQYFGTPEYDELRAALEANKGFTVVVRKIKKNPEKESYKGLKYENMENFIITFEPTALREYQLARKRSKIQASPYKWMVTWFITRFPNYKETNFFATLEAPIISNEKSSIEAMA